MRPVFRISKDLRSQVSSQEPEVSSQERLANLQVRKKGAVGGIICRLGRGSG
jgi:hypothetical protein